MVFLFYLTIPHITIDEVNINEVDLLIIPGGEPENILKKHKLYKLIKKLNEKGAIIGTICSGPIHLAKSGVLEGRKYTTNIPIEEYKEFEKSIYKIKMW